MPIFSTTGALVAAIIKAQIFPSTNIFIAFLLCSSTVEVQLLLGPNICPSFLFHLPLHPQGTKHVSETNLHFPLSFLFYFSNSLNTEQKFLITRSMIGHAESTWSRYIFSSGLPYLTLFGKTSQVVKYFIFLAIIFYESVLHTPYI